MDCTHVEHNVDAARQMTRLQVAAQGAIREISGTQPRDDLPADVALAQLTKISGAMPIPAASS